MSAQARKRLQVGVYALALLAAAAMMFVVLGPSPSAHGSSDDEGGGEPQATPTVPPRPTVAMSENDPEATPNVEEIPYETPAVPGRAFAEPESYSLDAINSDEDYYSTPDASRFYVRVADDGDDPIVTVSDGDRVC